MTLVRSPLSRSRVVHVSCDLRKTLCNRPMHRWVIEPDAAADCPRCIRVAQDIEENGN